jgi:hypothetical protein
MVGHCVTAGVFQRRNARRLAISLAAFALWLAGSPTTVQAGCGDYLVGVEQVEKHSSAPMAPDHDGPPQCRSCNAPAAPLTPVVQLERIPVELALPQPRSSPTLERGRWSGDEVKPLAQVLSRTPDRPPKV